MLQRYGKYAAEVWHLCCRGMASMLQRYGVYAAEVGYDFFLLIVIPLQVIQLSSALPWIVAIEYLANGFGC